MTNLATEQQHLGLAEHHLAEGEERITRQAALVEHLRGGGRSDLQLVEAEALLATFRETLRAWQGHREQILAAIARLEAQPGGPAEGNTGGAGDGTGVP